MCKHVAAVLYGIGARLDQQPELLFRLHKVNEKELIAKAGNNLPLSKKGPAAAKVLSDGEDLSALFGLDMAKNTKSNGKPAGRVPSKPKRPHQAIAALEASILRKRIAEAMKKAVTQQASAKNPVAKQTAPKPAKGGITAAINRVPHQHPTVWNSGWGTSRPV